MSAKPLVSITIPTYNSAAFLERCLDAIEQQTYTNIEVSIIDGQSKDETVQIAKKRGIKVTSDTVGLLSARKKGVLSAQGEFVLLLDSDQILQPTAIGQCVDRVEHGGLGMLVLGEDVYKADTLLEKLFQLDRDLIHAARDFSPFTGVMLPRFYRTNLLRQAFENIPDEALATGDRDHAIIYYEAWQLSQKVDLIPHLVSHVEPSTFREIIPKFYRWGYTSKTARDVKYKLLVSQKEGFRKGMFGRGLWVASIGSALLLLVKGVPYYLGLLSAKRQKAREDAYVK